MRRAHRRLLLVFVAILGTLASAGVLIAAPSGSGGGRLVFQRGFSIATMNVNGTGLTLLTSGSSYGPDWSPDGTKIAYMLRLSSWNLDIVVMNADGTNGVNLTNTEAAEFDPSWSPDGTKIAFSSGRNDPTGQMDIFVMNADGTDPVQLTTTANIGDLSPTWSPNGRKLAWNFGADIVVANADGTDQRTIASGLISPEWSPDGRAIVAQSNNEDDLYLIKPSGTPIRRLTATPTEGEGGASWSPNGRKLVFSRWNSTVTKVDLFTISRDGTRVTQITNDDVSDWSPDWRVSRRGE